MKTVDPNQSTLAKRIFQARNRIHISQEDLADKIGVTSKSISAYERGRAVPPFEKLKRIAEFTKQPITFFMEDQDDQAQIATKLQSIEEELLEIKQLLNQKKLI